MNTVYRGKVRVTFSNISTSETRLYVLDILNTPDERNMSLINIEYITFTLFDGSL